jgi:rod shape-determining protein MreC
MLFPSVNKQKTWLLVLLIAIISLNLYFHFTFVGTLQNRAQWLDRGFAKILSPGQRAIAWSEDKFATGTSTMIHLWNVDRENQSLKRQLVEKDLQLQQLDETRAENERLKAVLEFKKSTKLSFLPARIVGRDASLFFRTLEIDRGTEDGVQESAAVVSPIGVVGKILKTNAVTSTVLLVTDINSRVDATVQRSRSRVLVGGSAEGDLTLRYLPRRFDLRQGDVLVTSGFGGFFPEGFKIGVVVGMAQDPHYVLEQAVLEPAVDFDSIESVFVVKTVARWP